MSSFEVYFIYHADKLREVAGTAASTLFTLLMVMAGLYIVYYVLKENTKAFEKTKKKDVFIIPRKLFIVVLILLVVSSGFVAFLPTKDTAIKMVLIPLLLSDNNVQALQRIPEKLLKTLGLSLDKLNGVLSGTKK
jgi:uncharacterized membrane protein